MEFTAVWKKGRKLILQERGQEWVCDLFPPRALFLPTSLLPYFSFRNITFVLPISPTQKWRIIFWFSWTYYSSLSELLLHYSITENLVSPFQNVCQVSRCSQSGDWKRKDALAHQNQGWLRNYATSVHSLSLPPTRPTKSLKMGSDKHGWAMKLQ